MQHFLLQGRLLWIFLPALTMAINVITPGSTDGSALAGQGSLNLVSPNFMSNKINDRPVSCKNPDDPYHFTNSLNHTLPLTPPLPAPDFPPGESEVFAFDCYIELPGNIIGFDVCRMQRPFGVELKSHSFFYPNSTLTSISQIKGDIGSDLSLVFQVWIDISYFRYDAGVFRCSLVDVDKNPCVFNINAKVLVGQAGIFPEEDAADPSKLKLCFKVQATFHLPYRRAKSVNFERCFLTIDKPDDITIDELIAEPVFSNSTIADS